MMNWTKTSLTVDPPKRPKKITATRFASILGLNPWSSPFEIWCAVTRTYEKPFEDTIYTLAGKAIEPLQIAYMRKAFIMDNLRTPTDVYGADYFKKTYGDFFHDTPIFGGMWDSLLVDDEGKPEAVIEFKTTKRSEDWKNDVPEYYALQAALYAYLLGVDDVIMVGSFLEEKDYDAPEKFTPNASNTVTIEFKVSEKYPNFDLMVDKATAWWNAHVTTGVSPDFDEKKDAEILKALRNNSLAPDTDLTALIAEAEGLKSEIDAVSASVADKEKRLKAINDIIKEHAKAQFRPGDKTVSVKGSKFEWVLSKTQKTDIDKDALKKDGLFDKYSTTKEEYRLTSKEIKEEK